MNQYKINITYTKLNTDGDTVTKVMSFVSSANSLQEARVIVQETAMSYINRANGTFISVN
jgi:hypothetical protein